jgi:hypothetical protein
VYITLYVLRRSGLIRKLSTEMCADGIGILQMRITELEWVQDAILDPAHNPFMNTGPHRLEPQLELALLQTGVGNNSRLDPSIPNFAKFILGGRWPMAERLLLQRPRYPDDLLEYAIEVVGERWPEAEEYMLNGVSGSKEHIRPPAQDKMLQDVTSYGLDVIYRTLAERYREEVIKGPWPELETAVFVASL